jgi:hypothetical protein
MPRNSATSPVVKPFTLPYEPTSTATELVMMEVA